MSDYEITPSDPKTAATAQANERSDVGSSALLGCPFCGRPPTFERKMRPLAVRATFEIWCECGRVMIIEDTRAKAVSSWNERQPNGKLSDGG